MNINFTTGVELLELCEAKKSSISEIMIEREKNLFPQHDCLKQMERALEIMKDAVSLSLTQKEKSIGGLIGGEAAKLNQFRLQNRSLCGSLMSKALAYSMGVLEINASMGLIVAAPTAGSSGVIPGAFIAAQEELDLTDEELIMGLFNAGAVGYLVSRNATVAGAQGGCQAEVGTASAMAASALTEIMGGTPLQCLNAASISIANILGLVCDPIAGLVEAPCQKRNGMGATNAIISAEMSLSKIKSDVPFDEVIEAMYKVGLSMPVELRETALGGIAATKTACSFCRG